MVGMQTAVLKSIQRSSAKMFKDHAYVSPQKLQSYFQVPYLMKRQIVSILKPI
jgi:hypothetical protein